MQESVVRLSVEKGIVEKGMEDRGGGAYGERKNGKEGGKKRPGTS